MRNKKFVKVGENMSTGSNKKLKLRQTDRQGLLGLKSWIINKVRKPSKKRLSFSWKKKIKDDIEILDIDEKESHAKMRFKLPKIKSKKRLAITTVAVLIVFILTLLIIPGQNIIKIGARKFLDSLGIYTQEIKSVEIQSDDYNNPGSWHIDKSAKWIGLHKAQVTFDVNSVIKTSDNYKDIILVIDISGSMSGSKLEKAINDSKELVSYVLSDTNNRVALITFDSTSTIISEFSNEKNELLKKLDAITTTGCTNYDAALKNVDTIMNGYVKKSNRDITTLFLTDGYPNEGTPNQLGTYESLKDKYPYMTINGVQYEMGKEIIDEIKQITDSQWIADQSTLNNVLFEASVSPVVYEDFIVTDYIDEKFKVDSVDDIKVTIGTVALTEENGLQKITWNLGKNSYMTGGNAKMYINLSLKEKYAETDGFFSTNKNETIESKLSDETTKTVNSTKTPVLKGMYEVIYDTNTPDGCTLPSISSEKYFIYQNVTKKTGQLTCNGYLFKGWEIDEEDEKDIVKVNDDVFQMPGHDVTIRATWTRQSIVKSMNGKVSNKTTLYKVLESLAKEGIYAKEYTGSHKDSFNEDATQKIYYWYAPSYSTAGDTLATEILDKNNVIFAGHCWQMIRTTDTGGVKMIYNGEAENNQCLNTRGTHVGYQQSEYGDIQSMSAAYYYGTSYDYDSIAKSFALTGTITTGAIKTGQYTCMQTTKNATCTTLYYVDALSKETNYYVFSLNTDSHYSQFGTLMFNQQYKTLAAVGYMYNTKYIYNHSYLCESYSAIPVEQAKYINVVNDATYPFIFDSKTKTYISTLNQAGEASIKFNVVDAGDYILNYSVSIPESRYASLVTFIKNGEILKMDAGTKTNQGIKLIGLSPNDLIVINFSYPKYYDGPNLSMSFSIGTMQNVSTDGRCLYGNGFSYSNGEYTLKNAIRGDLSTDFSNAHYTCFNTTGKCSQISYIFNIEDDQFHYINIKDGKSVEDAKNEMLYNADVNTTDSTIKTGIDLWYEKYLLKYSNYLEDTIFCNDRTQWNSDVNGWNPNGGSLSTYMYFSGSNNLSCPNETDRFSTLNGKAKLKYKVGLMSYGEMNLLDNSSIRKTGERYWTGSPDYSNGFGGIGFVNYSDGRLALNSVGNTNGVRPAISLKPDTEYVDGDGSMANPYIVDTDS